MTGQAGSGSSGYVLFSDPEATPGTFQTPTNTLWATGITTTETADQIRKAYYAGARASENGLAPGKISSAGQFTYPLMPNVGVQWLKAALGKATYLAIGTPTTTTGTVTTANGISTLVLTADIAVSPGWWVQIGAGATLEMRQVISYVAGTKTLVVPALVANAAASSGLAVTQPGQHKISILTSTDTGFADLPRYSVAFAKGGLYDWRYPGTFAGQLKVAWGNQDATVTLDVVAPFAPFRATPSSFAPTATEYKDMSSFYTINQAWVATEQDETAAGTSSVGMLTTVESAEITIMNTPVEKRYLNMNRHATYYPTILNISGQYAYVNLSKRNAAYEDYIDTPLVTDVPLWISMWSNRDSVPTPQCLGFYVPNARLMNAPEQNPVNDVQLITVPWGADRPAGGNPLEVYCVNSRTTAYP
jgi:hypothetical protein